MLPNHRIPNSRRLWDFINYWLIGSFSLLENNINHKENFLCGRGEMHLLVTNLAYTHISRNGKERFLYFQIFSEVSNFTETLSQSSKTWLLLKLSKHHCYSKTWSFCFKDLDQAEKWKYSKWIVSQRFIPVFHSWFKPMVIFPMHLPLHQPLWLIYSVCLSST